MGTPDFAVPSLEILINAGYNIVAVITSTDKMGGRGRKTLIESSVKKCAKKHNIPVLQPKNLKSPAFVEELASYKADLQIVVAFRMLPEVVWNMPEHGTYNLHGSLLPKYRGAAPINWAVINGDTVTGVTSFKLKHEIDTGSLMLQEKIPIYESDNATNVHDRMMYVGAEVVLKTVQNIESGEYTLQEQDNSLVSHAPKLNKENTEINFSLSSKEVYDFIRGLSYFPGAWFNLGEKPAKVFKSSYDNSNHQYKPGHILSDNKTYLKIACQKGLLRIENIKYPGKKAMDIGDFLNGFDINPLLED